MSIVIALAVLLAFVRYVDRADSTPLERRRR